MIDTNDAASRWARRLERLRRQAVTRSRGAVAHEVTEEALSVCDALVRELAGAQLTCDRLCDQLRAANAAWDHLFDLIPSACLLTDRAGLILNANRAAGLLLNLSARFLKERELLVFSEDREAFRALLQQLDRGDATELRANLTLRPRERKPAVMHVRMRPLPGRDNVWLWIVTPAGASETRSTPFHGQDDDRVRRDVVGETRPDAGHP